MHLEIDIDSVRPLARIRIVGAFDVSEFSAGLTELIERPDFIPGMPAIWDLREADLMGVTGRDMVAVGEQSRLRADRRGNARVALVVPDDFRFGMARMLQVLGESPNLDMKVFREFGAAEEWIVGLPRSDD